MNMIVGGVAIASASIIPQTAPAAPKPLDVERPSRTAKHIQATDRLKARRFTPAGFSATIAICRSRLTNFNDFSPLHLTGHGNAITGRVGLAQFPKAWLGRHWHNT
jgi:hypothetical protein